MLHSLVFESCTGSSAGAGSGDFHVYRGVRRREYARQKFMKNFYATVRIHFYPMLVQKSQFLSSCVILELKEQT